MGEFRQLVRSFAAASSSGLLDKLNIADFADGMPCRLWLLEVHISISFLLLFQCINLGNRRRTDKREKPENIFVLVLVLVQMEL